MMRRVARTVPVLALLGSVLAGCAGRSPMTTDQSIQPTYSALTPRTVLARGELLAETKRLIRDRNVYVLPAYHSLIATADSLLRAPALSVVQKRRTPPSGDKHDYMSAAPYWWPDSTKRGGLPYIRIDGRINPESRMDHDGVRFLGMTDAVEALSLAWYFTGDRKYAARASTLLRVWFIDPATRMNPHLRYAQAIPGVVEGRGIGIIDLRHFPRLLDAIRVLDFSGEWLRSDADAMVAWTAAYLRWLRESANGKQERAELNNHGTLYDAQTAALALFIGDTAFARELIAESAVKRLRSHFAPNGAQPGEISRTRPVHYSLFNLDGFTQLAEMGRHIGVDLWRGGSSTSRIVSGLAFIAPYADGQRTWPTPEVSPIAPDVATIALRRAAAQRADTLLARMAHRAAALHKSSYREVLLYPGATLTSLRGLDSLTTHALDYAKAKLMRSATALDPSRGFPRVTTVDGRWEQRPYNDWTSGFFAGMLWYMYHLERRDEWRMLAEKWTVGMEPAKMLRSTHDLGFMVYNSFGHGLTLTGNPHYRQVVIDASRSLSTRYNPVVGAIKSWDTESRTDRRGTWKYPVIVDNLMNLEMLFHASQWGDRKWSDIALSHALKSAAAHVRGDGSTPHVALFDPITGKLERTVTWQGHSDTSAWARGQAWAIHGFTAAYGHTKRPELLSAAVRTANYFIAHLPPDGVPYWDLLHPSIPGTERDASAAAIAASGLLDLARHTRGAESARFKHAAQRMIAALSADYLTTGTSSQAILQHSVGQRPQNVEIDVGIVYADYYFIEALLKLRGIYWH
ncbi:MAG TPA: alginate lyase family protein [Gemmatimonadaceae bacterium]|nr:alginate lyase family protein [Gemmatimonadaceae bacterium]